MTSSTTQALQFSLTGYLRDPDGAPAPANADPERLKIYQELIFNNIEGFVSSGFPILRQLQTEVQWLALVRAFVRDYRAQTPYFLEIGQAFLDFVQQRPDLPLPAFAAELMHYEWVELALDVAPEQLPAPGPDLNDSAVLKLSPLAWPLAYQYPVHRIGPDFQPETPPAQPTFLVVYRDRVHKVRFMALSAMSYALLEACTADPGLCLGDLRDAFTSQFQQANNPQFAEQLQVMVQQFVDQDILLSC